MPSRMPFSLEQFARLRPYVYHLTHPQYEQQIRRTFQLEPAASLLDFAGSTEWWGRRRNKCVQVVVKGQPVIIRDQQPLHERNIELQPDWSFSRLVAHLNSHVFFWAGTETGPIPHGERHFHRYRMDKPLILKVPLASFCASNPDVPPQFCKFNSGAPRWAHGKPSPRGAATFQVAQDCDFRMSDVVEVVFSGPVVLPPETEFRTDFE